MPPVKASTCTLSINNIGYVCMLYKCTCTSFYRGHLLRRLRYILYKHNRCSGTCCTCSDCTSVRVHGSTVQILCTVYSFLMCRQSASTFPYGCTCTCTCNFVWPWEGDRATKAGFWRHHFEKRTQCSNIRVYAIYSKNIQRWNTLSKFIYSFSCDFCCFSWVKCTINLPPIQ